jgi:hypothetical protein
MGLANVNYLSFKTQKRKRKKKNKMATAKNFLPYKHAICFDNLFWARNQLGWEEKVLDPILLSRRINSSYMEHRHEWDSMILPSPQPILWTPPPPNWIKFNFDATIRSNRIFIAVVGRDPKESLISARTERFHVALLSRLLIPSFLVMLFFTYFQLRTRMLGMFYNGLCPIVTMVGLRLG